MLFCSEIPYVPTCVGDRLYDRCDSSISF